MAQAGGQEKNLQIFICTAPLALLESLSAWAGVVSARPRPTFMSDNGSSFGAGMDLICASLRVCLWGGVVTYHNLYKGP